MIRARNTSATKPVSTNQNIGNAKGAISTLPIRKRFFRLPIRSVSASTKGMLTTWVCPAITTHQRIEVRDTPTSVVA
jgi:hypothetical protein